MKKNVCRIVALVAVASMPLLAGCGEKPQNYQHPLVYDVDYRGHHYIVFRVNENLGQTFVHDPDCPCGKAK